MKKGLIISSTIDTDLSRYRNGKKKKKNPVEVHQVESQVQPAQSENDELRMSNRELAREQLRIGQLETLRRQLARETMQLESERLVREQFQIHQREQLERDQSAIQATAQLQEAAEQSREREMQMQQEEQLVRFRLQMQQFSMQVAARHTSNTYHPSDDNDNDNDNDDDDTPDESVKAEADAQRQIAIEHYKRGKDLSILSQQAYSDGVGGLAKELSDQKIAAYALRDQFNKEAAELYFLYYNPCNGYNKNGVLYLHGLYKFEAKIKVKECIEEKIAEGAESARFIVGLGNNSIGGIQVIKPTVIGMVMEYVCNKYLHFTDEGGAILVHFR
jgi:hypothetical protein